MRRQYRCSTVNEEIEPFATKYCREHRCSSVFSRCVVSGRVRYDVLRMRVNLARDRESAYLPNDDDNERVSRTSADKKAETRDTNKVDHLRRNWSVELHND